MCSYSLLLRCLDSILTEIMTETLLFTKTWAGWSERATYGYCQRLGPDTYQWEWNSTAVQVFWNKEKSLLLRTYRLRVGFTWANKISQHSESFLETHMPHFNYNLLVRKFYIRLGWMPILLATTYFFLQKIITYLGTF